MELRQYWRIVRRYLWLILGIVVITAVASLALRAAHPRQQSYAASMRFTVGIEPEDGQGDYYTYDRYYTWLASEYLVDDLSEVVKSASFASAVSEELAGQGVTVAPAAISGSTTPAKLHRILTVTITGPDASQLEAIANAAAKVLSERNAEFLAQLSSENAAVYLIDPPGIYPVPAPLRDRLDLPLRLVLALAAAIGLAFVLDYVDDSVRDERDLEALGVPLLTRLPRQR